jgi:hypothetical protein
MTDFEREIAKGLSGCSFVPASWDKRFAQDVAAKPSSYVMSSRQRGALLLLAWKYRRQIGLALDADNKARRITRLILSEIERDPASLRGLYLPKDVQKVFQQSIALQASREAAAERSSHA